MDKATIFNVVVETSIMLKQHTGVKKFALVGSAAIEGMEEQAKDVDFLVLMPDGGHFLQDMRWAFGSDWTLLGGKYDDQTDKWGSIRKGAANLIVTSDAAWYDRMVMANEVVRALKLTDKGDRIVVHRIIRDGYDAAAANQRRDGRS